MAGTARAGIGAALRSAGVGWGGVYGWNNWSYGPYERRIGGRIHHGERIGVELGSRRTNSSVETRTRSTTRSGVEIRTRSTTGSGLETRTRSTTGSGVEDSGHRRHTDECPIARMRGLHHVSDLLFGN